MIDDAMMTDEMPDEFDILFEKLKSLTQCAGFTMCFAINQIGILFLKGSKKAEEFLLSLLKDKTMAEEERYLAFCFLSDKPDSETVKEAIRRIENDPYQRDFLEKVRIGKIREALRRGAEK